MNKQEIKKEVQDIFRDILDNEELLLSENQTARDVKGWDSLTHINLVSTIEKHYKIRFSLRELDELKNVGDMLAAIENKVRN